MESLFTYPGVLLLPGVAVLAGVLLGLLLRPSALRFKRTVESFQSLEDLGQAVDQLPQGSIKRVQLVMLELLMVDDEVRGVPPRRPADYIPRLYAMTQERSKAQFLWPTAIVLAAGGVVMARFAILFVGKGDRLAATLAAASAAGMLGGAALFVRLARGPIRQLWRRFETARGVNRPQRLDELRAAALEFQAVRSGSRHTHRTSAST